MNSNTSLMFTKDDWHWKLGKEDKNGLENKKLTCKRCGESFSYDSKDTYFDDHGYGYSTKLVKCSHCNTPNVIKHHEEILYKQF